MIETIDFSGVVGAFAQLVMILFFSGIIIFLIFHDDNKEYEVKESNFNDQNIYEVLK